MTIERSASNAIGSALDRLLARWAEDSMLIIHRVAKEIEPYSSEPGDDKWRERVEECQNHFSEELDQCARKLIEAERDEQAATTFAAYWDDQRGRMQIEHYLRRRVSDADRAFDRELCESWARAEESRMDKALESSRKLAEERREREEEQGNSADS